jgi:hypothetical protein
MNTTFAWSGAVVAAIARAERRSWNFITSISLCFEECREFARDRTVTPERRE